MHMKREKFIEANSKKFEKMLPIISNALKNAGIDKKDINNVILSGGSTKIPHVRDTLEKFFKAETKRLHFNIDPEEVTAAGAAMLAEHVINDTPWTK